MWFLIDQGLYMSLKFRPVFFRRLRLGFGGLRLGTKKDFAADPQRAASPFESFGVVGIWQHHHPPKAYSK